jgi:hypothetical protein
MFFHVYYDIMSLLLTFTWKRDHIYFTDAGAALAPKKVGARKFARCHFQVPVLKVRSQLKFLQGANFFRPKLWMIACTWHVQFHV